MKRLHTRTTACSVVTISIAALLSITNLHAQIQVGTGGTPVITFDGTVTLPASEWATSQAGVGAAGAGTFTTAAAVDAAAQTVNQSAHSEPLAMPTAYGLDEPAQHNTTDGTIFTQPTGVASTILKATLRNASGGTISSMVITYDFANGGGVPGGTSTEGTHAPGQRVFYSLTGLPNSWQPIPNFSGLLNAATVSATLSLGTWNPNSDMYIIWLDDNTSTNPDGTNIIDNFTITDVVTLPTTCVAITNQTGNITVPERGAATFSIMATGTPQSIQWFRNGVAIPGATLPDYTIPSVAFPGDNGAQFFATVSNVQCQVQSTPVTLTVQQDLAPPQVVKVVGEAALDAVTVTFNEAINPNFDPSTFTFTLFETGTNPDLSPFITYNATLTNGTNIILQTDPRAPGVNYSLRITDIRDASSGNNLINPNPTVVALRTVIQLIGFDTDNEWKYDINNGDRTGTGWELPGFDDSTWPSGPAGLGLDASANGVPIRTTLPYTANGVVTYFRRHFTLPAPTNGVILTLRDVVEDGAVYYLNGQEIFRHRMPAGAVNFATVAQGAAEPQPVEGPFNLAITNLLPGDNVLAVSVHQSTLGGSSDIELAVELNAEVGALLSGPPVIRTQPQSQTVNEGSTASFNVVAEGSLPLHYQWFKGAGAITDATNSTYAIAAASPSDAASYSVVVSNTFGTATSQAATLTVNPDLSQPQFISAVAETNLTNITLVITDTGTGLNPANVANVANYDVHLRAGGGNLTVLSATIVNGTNVVLTTSPRTQGQDYTIVLSNIRDRSAAANLVTPTTRSIRANIIILAPDATTLWRYESSSNNLDGTGWQLPAFNDSAWPQALAGFTTSNALEITTNGFELRTTNMLSPVSGGPVTTYYRVPFNFPGSTAGAALQIVGVVDDGLVAYINGVEAGRLRITNASPVSFTNLASAAGPETTEFHPAETITLTNLAGLVSGANLLAVELHQNSLTSSDSVLSIQLVAGLETSTVTPTGPRLNIGRNPSTGLITISWTTAGCTLQETSALQNPPGNTVWTASTVQNGVPFTPSGTMKFYRLSGCP